MRPERRPPRVLDPRPALPQHPGHGRGQVVVADLPRRDAAQDRERVHVAFQEGFLPAGRRHQVDRLAGIRHPEREQVALDQDPGQPHPQLPEVDLRLQARRVMLRDEHPCRAAAFLDADLWPAAGHVVADGRIRHVPGSVLTQQPGVDPRRGVPLLARRVQVRPQPPVDHRLERLQPGRTPLRRLARSPAQPGSAPPAPAAGAPRTWPPAPAPTSPRATNHAGSARTTRPWRPPQRPPQAHTHPDPPTSSSPAGPLQADTTIPAATTTEGWGQIKPSWWGQSEPS